MEAGDQNRPRLDSAGPSYGSSSVRSRPQPPPPPPPQYHNQRHTSYADHYPPPQAHHPPPPHPPPPHPPRPPHSQSYSHPHSHPQPHSHTHPPPPPPPPPPPHSLPHSSGTLEPRAPQPEPPSSLVPRPNHGPPMNPPPPRPYPSESPYPRSTGTPSQTVEPQRRPLPVAGSNEGSYTSMEYSAPPPVYAPQQEHHMSNGSVQHPVSTSPHDHYAGGQMGPSPGYPPTPVSAYAQPGPYITQSYPGAPRRKQVRATQACNLCRQRKQKCDEARPACTACRDLGMECQYKDVPPPKQDRTLMQLTDSIQLMLDKMQNMEETLHQLVGDRPEFFQERERLLKKPRSSIQSPQDSTSAMAEDTVSGSAESADAQKRSPETPALVAAPAPAPAPPRPSQSYVGHASPPGPQIKVEQTARVLPADEGDQSDDADLTLPLAHKTPAHQLLKDWKSMEQFTVGVEGYTADYPLELELQRGVLRLYGRGEGDDKGDGAQLVGSPPSSANGDEVFAAPSPEEGLWGIGMASSASVDMQRSESCPGGCNPDGSMKLDAPTVRHLFDSFVRHIHMLHPFLDKGRLGKMVERFISRYSPTTNQRSPFPAPHIMNAPDYTSVPLKRKRSTGGPISTAYAAPDHHSVPIQPKVPERSISNAIILLTLALGKICEHKEKLPGPVGSPRTANDSPYSPSVESPPATIKPSPAASHSPLASMSSPSGDSYRYGHGGQRMSIDGSPGFGRSSTARNMDVIPGLAYFAYATDIIGNLLGANDLALAQAHLLAGLYMGQLARVLESWSWINHACRIVRLLIEKDKHHLRPEPVKAVGDGHRIVPRPVDRGPVGSGFYAKMDLLKLAFWTCLQLESDILAELSTLPSSGVSQYEHRVALPSGVYLDMPTEAPDEKLNMVYYSAQIHLRKILNRAHSKLYGSKSQSRTKSSWIQASAPFLQEWLEEWRQSLPAQLAWEGSALADDINNARLRAKYYGAKYIITRPSLYYAIHEMNPTEAEKEKYRQLAYSTSPPSSTHYDLDGEAIMENCKQCIQAAIDSTVAFDKVPDRMIVTNIFGTMHAQFSNMLVLAATYDSWLGFLIPDGANTLNRLFARTIRKLKELAPLSPALKMDAQILENTQRYLHRKRGAGAKPGGGSEFSPPVIPSAHGSFHSHRS